MASVVSGWRRMAPKLWRNSPLRLLGVYTGIFAAGVIVLLSMVTLHLTSTIEHETDVTIGWQLQYLATLDAPALRSIIAARIDDAAIVDEHYGLFTAGGKYIAGDIVVQPAIPPHIGSAGWTASRVMLRGGADLEQIRLLVRRRADGDFLYDGRNLGAIMDIRHAFIAFLIYGGCLVLVASVLVGAGYARRQIRRMHEIQAIVMQISDGALHLRLPEYGRDEIALLNGLVNSMLDDIERLMREVKGACDGIAHDLRTPLARVRLLLEEIEHIAREPASTRDAASPPTDAGSPSTTRYEQIAVAAETAAAATDHLRLRFNAMLRISELHSTRRKTGFGNVDLTALVAQLAALYEPVALEKQVRWRVDTPDRAGQGTRHALDVFADEMLLFEALSNIVDNAIKFTPAGGEVRITLSDARGKPYIVVADTGPGVPASERQAVFSPFYRQRSHAALEGSGLGLSIVDAILNLHQFPYALADAWPGHAQPGLRISILCHPTHEHPAP